MLSKQEAAGHLQQYLDPVIKFSFDILDSEKVWDGVLVVVILPARS